MFHQRHPLLSGIFIMAVLFAMFWGGLTLVISLFTLRSTDQMFAVSEAVGVVELKGVILNAEEPLKNLRKFADSDGIKAVVVRIDSPGGAVGASQEIFSEMQQLATIKPVVASLGSVAASGGYYAALGAEKIMASPGTLTGSMGVIMKFADLQQIFQKVGYKSQVIKSGQFKDIGSSSRDMTPAERRLLQDLIDSVHQQFVDDIAQSRGLTTKEVKAVADGRIFSGAKALELGLIDELGNFNDAAILAAELAGLGEGKMPKLIYPRRDEGGLLSLLMGQARQKLENLSSTTPLLAYEWTM